MSGEVVLLEDSKAVALQMRNNVNLIQTVMKDIMIGPCKEHPDGVHFGVIPGTKKKSLLKPGAEVLGVTFRIGTSYRTEDLSGKGYVRYRIVAIGTHQTSGTVMGEGMGECSSLEEKYKWRKATRSEFDHTEEGMRRIKYGYDRTTRKDYEILQVRTEAADLANTVLKMACKRAHVAMILNVLAASDIFTQDVEDLPEELRPTVTDEETEQKKPDVKMPEAKQETNNAGTSGNNAADDTGELAEPGEVAFITKKLEALPDRGKELLGAIKLESLTKAQFVSLRDAIRSKK